jgi:hypothetical protein
MPPVVPRKQNLRWAVRFHGKKTCRKWWDNQKTSTFFMETNNEVTFQTYGNELAHENNWKYMKHTWQWRSTYGRNTCNSYGPNMVQMVELPWFVTSHQRPRRPSAKVIRVNHQARIDKLQLPPISPKNRWWILYITYPLQVNNGYIMVYPHNKWFIIP